MNSGIGISFKLNFEAFEFVCKCRHLSDLRLVVRLVLARSNSFHRKCNLLSSFVDRDNFFVTQSGKWSMADVLVVAIFMAYIGFNGIINSQLDTMSEAYTNLELITTNGTSLQPGYNIFLCYVILAMFLSHFIKNRPHECKSKNEDKLPE
jgi:hypothetical protein